MAEVLLGIIGAIISWILNRVKEVAGSRLVSQNLWALVIGVGGLLYTYMVMRNKLNDLILNLTPENMTQHSRIE